MNPLQIEVTDREVRVTGLTSSTEVWPLYVYENARYREQVTIISKKHSDTTTASMVVNLHGDLAEKIIRAYKVVGIE